MTTRGARSAVAFGFGILLATCSAQGQTLDPVAADALAATLRSLGARAAQGTNGSPRQIPDLDPRIHALAESPELTREVYELAGEIFTEIADRAGGDPDKMSEALARGKSDPSAFASSLSPATQERLRALASKLSPDRP